MGSGWIPWLVVVGLAVACGLYLRSERKTHRVLAAAQQAVLGEVLVELGSLRSALVAGGAVSRIPKLPPPAPTSELPSVERRVVTVTRDDDPVHTRPTVEVPRPAGTDDEPPSTKPSQSRTMPAPASPRSSPRPVPFSDQVRRAKARLERQVKVPPEVEARWLERLAELGAELSMSPDVEPTDAQIEVMIRELYQAEADLKDARDGAPAGADPTLPAAVAPIAVRIAEAARRGPDADGEATLRALPRANVDEDDDGREGGEEPTMVYGHKPGARPPLPKPPPPVADPLAGVALERPTSSHARTAQSFRSRQGQRPTLLGGLNSAPPPTAGEEEGETS